MSIQKIGTKPETILIEKMEFERLRAVLQERLLLPEDEAFKTASQPWNLYIHQKPLATVMATSVEDIVASIQFARTFNVGVGVMATGHGVGKPCNGGLLINTSKMRGISIDPINQIAKVEPGAQWKDVIGAAKIHGLVALAGSAPHVGVVGYTVGGGFGYLGRKYGLNSSSVTRADIVLADGNLVSTSATENSDLFWATKGGGGNFGIIASLEFRLYPLKTIFGGAVFYPMEIATEALSRYTQWTQTIPNEITTAIAFMNIPQSPQLPEVLRGHSVIVIKGCYCGHDSVEGEELFKSIREISKPILDTFRVMPVEMMDTISKDPVDPMAVVQYGSMITKLTDDAIHALNKAVGIGSESPLFLVELRKLGGALADHDGIKLMNQRAAEFSLNAIGPAFNPALAEKSKSRLMLLAKAMSSHENGSVFLNFLEVDPSEDRTRAAYTEEDWHKLVNLKAQYDPTNIFRYNRNILPAGNR